MNDGTATIPDEDVVRSFPLYRGPVEPGFVIDFLGTRTRSAFCGYLPAAGHVEGYPIPMNWHATMLEWAGTLRAVLEAGREVVAVELGAGWAPWLVAVAHAARHRGVAGLRLVGVEGSVKHCGFMRQHFLDNGLAPEEHALLHGVVGTQDGVAHFPEFGGSVEYGGVAVFRRASGLRRLYRLCKRAARRLLGRRAAVVYEPVPSYSLQTLLAPYPRIDLVHIDIQGHEHEVVTSAAAVLDGKVRRMVIGTHGRQIERDLKRDLAARGWVLEGDEEALYKWIKGREGLLRDGCQVWRNPQVKAALRAAA
jgi:hypothetical protein